MPIKIGSIIREQAEKRGLTQAELGKLINLHEKTVAGIYRRETMDTDLLLKISSALNYDFFEHYYEEEPLKSLRGSKIEELQASIERLLKEGADKRKYIMALEELNESQKAMVTILRDEVTRYRHPNEADLSESNPSSKPQKAPKKYGKTK